MHSESLKVGGAFQTMSEVVNSTRQRHLQHSELETNNAVIGWTHAVFHFQVVNIFCVLCVNMFTFLSDVMVVCSIIK